LSVYVAIVRQTHATRKMAGVQRAKGTRDFLPREKRLRQWIVGTIKDTFECCGFQPYETPILERYETVSLKYGGGKEILKEVFKLKDQGKRELALRYEFTTSLARMIAVNSQLKMPLKLFQIGPVFRDGPIEAGRVREFWQCDVDIIGADNIKADAEVITTTSLALKRLGLKVKIKANSRKLLLYILDYADVEGSKKEDVILTVDKLYKIGLKGVKEELSKLGISENSFTKLTKILSLKGNNNKKIFQLKKILGDCSEINELEGLISFCKLYNTDLELDLSLVRGLVYYTGSIFEAVLEKGPICSVGGGGRYDNLIGLFGRECPAVGFSIGLDRIYDALLPTIKKQQEKIIFIIPIGSTFNEAVRFTALLRDNGVPCDIELTQRKLSKSLEYASDYAYVCFIGEKERKLKKVKIRDMQTGNEKLVSYKKAVEVLTKD